MVMTREELINKIVDDLMDIDLLNIIDYTAAGAKAEAASVIAKNLVDYYIVLGDML
jgi:hypothetical protein